MVGKEWRQDKEGQRDVLQDLLLKYKYVPLPVLHKYISFATKSQEKLNP